MKLIAFSILLFAATAICAQPRIPQAPMDYSSAYKAAVRENRALLVFVGVPERAVAGSVVCRFDSYPGVPRRCIITARPDGDGGMYQERIEEVAVEQAPFAPPDRLDQAPVGDGKLPPKGSKYVRARYTQSISVLNGYDNIERVPRDRLAEWARQSGGMEGITGYRSDVYRHVPKDATPFITSLGVLNSFGYIQQNRGWTRNYPDGTRFDDVLTNTETGGVFEHRVAFKENGRWIRRIIASDPLQRPAGYAGLKQSCASCHEGGQGKEPGTGGYAAGMIPGADGVYSDPFEALELK